MRRLCEEEILDDDDSDGVEDETISIKKTRTASKDGDSIQFISSDQRHHRGSFSS